MKPHSTVEDALKELGKIEEEARLHTRSIITAEYKRFRGVVLDWACSAQMSDTSIRFFMELGREKARNEYKGGKVSWWKIFVSV